MAQIRIDILDGDGPDAEVLYVHVLEDEDLVTLHKAAEAGYSRVFSEPGYAVLGVMSALMHAARNALAEEREQPCTTR